LGRHDESRIKRIIVGERPSTAIRVVGEHGPGMGGRPAKKWIGENTAVNPSNLIECFFNVIPRRLGKIHWVIGRRHYRIEAFLVCGMCTRGWNADRRRVAYVWIVAKEPIVSVIWHAILINIAGAHAKAWWIIGRRVDVKSGHKLGRGLEILQTRRRGLRLSHLRKDR
jgi:hypothetical protein